MKYLLILFFAMCCNASIGQNFRVDSIKICDEDGQLKSIRINGYQFYFDDLKLKYLVFRDSSIFYDVNGTHLDFKKPNGGLIRVFIPSSGIFKICDEDLDTCIVRPILDKASFAEQKVSIGVEHSVLDSSILAFSYYDSILDAFSIFNRRFGSFNMSFDNNNVNKLKELMFHEYGDVYIPDMMLVKIRVSFKPLTEEIRSIGIYDSHLQSGVEIIIKGEKKIEIEARERIMVSSYPELFKYRTLFRYNKGGKINSVISSNCE